MDNPSGPPVITSLSPTSATAGIGGTLIIVSGSNFTPSSTVLWNGSALSTFYDNSTKIEGQLNAANLLTVGTVTVTVSDPVGGISNAFQFTITSPYPPGFGSIHYDATTGCVYADSGRVIDPTNGAVVGTFTGAVLGYAGNDGALMVPDGSLGTVFFLGQTQSTILTTTYTLQSFDIHKFTPLASLTIQEVAGISRHLIRWGTSGLAFTTANDIGNGAAVYIINNSSFVNSSELRSRPAENVQRTWKFPDAGHWTH